MVSIEASRSASERNAFQRWNDGRRLRKERSWEEKWVEKWEALIHKFDGYAYVHDSPSRYTSATPTTQNGYYFSILRRPDEDIVFIDRDRDRGEGERSAILCTDREVIVFETQKPTERHERKDPHNWAVVNSPKKRKRLIEEKYGSLSKTYLFNYDGDIPWRGYVPDPENLLKAISSSPSQPSR